MNDLLATRVARLRWMVLLLWGALQLVFLWKTLIAPMGGRDPNVSIWLLHSLPLMLFLPGLWRGDYRMFTWLSFAILMYFAATVEALFSPAASGYHWAALVIIVLLFTACLIYVRSVGQLAQSNAADETKAIGGEKQ